MSSDTTKKRLNQLLADEVEALVGESFTGVEAPWWWERRMSGGVVICQEFAPDALVSEMAEAFARDQREVRRAAVRTLGLESLEPVVLTFDLDADTTIEEAARILDARSATAAGLAEGVYRALARALRDG